MDIVPVNCNRCGASLEIPADARFVTCRYCNAQLEIQRSESAITTQVLQRIDQSTASMAQDLQAIRRETEIERLDREWAQRQGELMSRDKRGNVSRPTATGGIAVAVIMGGFGLLWTILASSMFYGANRFGAPAPFQMFSLIFPLFGLLFVATAIGIGIKTVVNAGRYDRAERFYQARRAELLGQESSRDAEH